MLRVEPELDRPGRARRPRRRAATSTTPPPASCVRPGRLTAIVAARPEDAAAIADRLGRYVDADVRGAAAAAYRCAELPSTTSGAAILVADNDARLFTGRAARRARRTGAGDAVLTARCDAAAADDIVEALPDGLDTEVAERGRAFSGGQQQRLRAGPRAGRRPARCWCWSSRPAPSTRTPRRASPSGCAAARAGRTTVVCTTSPLLLDRADEVRLRRRTAGSSPSGTHRELLDHLARAYAATVDPRGGRT